MLKFHWLLLKVWVALIAALLLLVFIAEGLRRIGSTRLLLIVILLSCVAYFIREKRAKRMPRPRNNSARERTPIMPRTKS